jgi:DNA primase
MFMLSSLTDTLWHWVDPDKTGEKYGTLVSKKAKEFGIKLRQILSEEDMSDFLTKYGHTALREKLHD